MSRRSHSTLNATEKARSAARNAYLTDREQHHALKARLASLPSYRLEDVLARLDAQDAAARRASERRLAAYKPVDLGDEP